MKHLTGNQVVALYVLGYVPKGYTCATQRSSGVPYTIGIICVDGVPVCSVLPESNGLLPSSESIGS